jgi:hypothetical protein
MEAIKSVFGGIVGIAFWLLLLLVPAAFIWGGLFLAGAALPWLAAAAGIQFVLTVAVLVPLAFFRTTRLLAGRGIRFFSYLLGVTAWLWGIAVTYLLWGGLAVFIGLFLFGFGVVPMALVAYAIEGMWSPMLQLLATIVAVFASRIAGYWLIERAEQEATEVRYGSDA